MRSYLVACANRRSRPMRPVTRLATSLRPVAQTSPAATAELKGLAELQPHGAPQAGVPLLALPDAHAEQWKSARWCRSAALGTPVAERTTAHGAYAPPVRFSLRAPSPLVPAASTRAASTTPNPQPSLPLPA